MDAGTVIMIVALAAMAMVTALLVFLGIVVTRSTRALVRRSRPSVQQARRHLLNVRAQTARGPARELMTLDISLHDSLEATRRSLEAALATRQHVGNLEAIVGTLGQAGALVGRQLVVARKDPDQAVQRIYVQTLGAQVAQITATAAGVRTALAKTAQPMTTVDLGTLTRRLEVEAAVLQTWSATYNGLGTETA